MYIAGRTRTASSPSRTRMAPAPYSAASSSIVLMSSVMSPGEPSLCRPHLAVVHVEDASQPPQPPHPVAMGSGDQGLAPLRNRTTQGQQAVLVQLRVEVVEQRDRGVA